MHGLSLVNNVEFARASNAIAAGTGTTNGSAIAVAGRESVVFEAALGTQTATNTTQLKIQESADGSTNWTDIPGATVTANDTNSNKLIVVEAIRPSKAFVRYVLIRSAANSVIDGVFAKLAHNRKSPVTQGSTVAGSAVGIPTT